jgi:hypothetical protein
MASNGCALGSDGKLLDASEIIWHYDTDNDEPMASVTTSSTGQPQPGLSATTLDSFMHQSGCAAYPSTKLIDPDNTMAIKRKTSDASNLNLSHWLCQASPEHGKDKVIDPDITEPDTSPATEPGEDKADTIEPDYTDMEEDISVNLDDAYEKTKALRDADHKVCVQCSTSIID